jgi:predicted nicotinamide N-methyase
LQFYIRIMPAEKQLLARIRRRYQTVTETVRLPGLEFPFVRIADPDRVLDEVAEAEDRLERLSGQRASSDQLHLPYWAELWDSALGISQWLVRQAEMSSQKWNVLDLGCGMGLTGTVAARLGHRVLFADLEPPALLFAQLNSLPTADRVRTRRLDWRTDRLDETFDLIIGADILYERKQWDFLEPFWRAHLKPGGTVLLGEPGRQTGDLFQPWIRDRGWDLHLLSESVPTRATPIRLMLLRELGTSPASV